MAEAARTVDIAEEDALRADLYDFLGAMLAVRDAHGWAAAGGDSRG